MTGPDISTMDALRALGFQPDAESNDDNCLRFDFGHYQLNANVCRNRVSEEVVRFTDSLGTQSASAEISFEMPSWVASSEQCAALILWCLDQCENKDVFAPERRSGWLVGGLGCTVLCDGLRVALGTVASSPLIVPPIIGAVP